jgi:hypothetical protein
MGNKTFEVYKQLPSWAKGVTIVGGLTVVYIFASQVVKKIREQAANKQNEQAVESAKDEIEKLKQSGMKATITKARADAMADSIVNQYKNADLLLQSGALTTRIFNELKNDLVFLMLKTSFGVRTYPDAFFGNVSNVTLEAAIQNELFNTTINSLNKILKTKGIKYSI